MEKTIVITGHTSGIGKIIFENFGGIGLSRATGFNICVDKIGPFLNSNVIFINNAYSFDCHDAQLRLLNESYKIANSVINIGSNTRYEGVYKKTKDELEKRNNELFLQNYKTTYLSLGKVDTPFQQNYTGDKISRETIIKTINYIITTNARIQTINIRPYDDI